MDGLLGVALVASFGGCLDGSEGFVGKEGGPVEGCNVLSLLSLPSLTSPSSTSAPDWFREGRPGLNSGALGRRLVPVVVACLASSFGSPVFVSD